jgi:hypothetical protein
MGTNMESQQTKRNTDKAAVAGATRARPTSPAGELTKLKETNRRLNLKVQELETIIASHQKQEVQGLRHETRKLLQHADTTLLANLEKHIRQPKKRRAMKVDLAQPSTDPAEFLQRMLSMYARAYHESKGHYGYRSARFAYTGARRVAHKTIRTIRSVRKPADTAARGQVS